ncbi:MAG TPA: hypothetical protein VEX41_01185, partial [Candidatus Eisenbacteria bacterium]|nr:hypothetical protein [Candidatus Eisenbacteria bacterium]
GKVQLAEHSVRWNKRVLGRLISESSALRADKAAAGATVSTKIAEAAAAIDGDTIYRRLVEAQAPVNRLYKGQVTSLQVHHIERVKQNPATFEKTRAGRLYSRTAARIKNGSKSMTAEEKEIAKIQDAARRREVIKVYVAQLLEKQVEEGPARLTEVEMNVLTSVAHSAVHAAED